MADLGREFARAFADKDFDRVAEVVAPGIDFRGLTPSRAWEASSADQLIADVLTSWLEDSDHVDELLDDGPFVFEQHAYFTEADGRIDWMRVLCSGFRPG